MIKNDLVIRIAGESGEGIVTTGEVFSQIAAFAGLEVYTFRTFPAEILGGHVMFQLRIGEEPLFSQGDALDVLLAFNQEAYDRHHGELKPGGVLIYDRDELSPPEVPGEIRYGLPLAQLAKEIDFTRGKNILTIGCLVKLFDLPYDKAKETVVKRLGRKAELLDKNLQALEMGYKYVQENIPKEDSYLLQPQERGKDERLLLTGNQALSLGAIAAGCRFYAGYPITPATDIMEFLAAQLPKVGGTVMQAEDEMAAIAMVLGASYTGVRAMTATSGPGLSLMVELLGHASMTEVPAVIVDVQRAGPSTGMPTKTAQGDLFLALRGGNDEGPRIVLVPTDVADCFYQTIIAFNLAEKYQVPVLILSDQSLAHRVETIPPFDIKGVRLLQRILPDLDRDDGYRRYQITDTGISPMSLPGMPGGYYTAEGLEHDDRGAPNYEPEMHTSMTQKRFRKLAAAAQEMRSWGMTARFGHPQPKIGVMGWGSTYGPVKEAVNRAVKEGIPVAGFYTKAMNPLPEEEMRAFISSAETILVPEVNYTGQYADLLGARFGVQPVRVNKYGGLPFIPQEIYKEIMATHEQLAMPAK